MKKFEQLLSSSKVDVLNVTFLKFFEIYISSKKVKCDYRQLQCVTKDVEKLLKERIRLTRQYYKNNQKTEYCEKVLREARDRNIES